MSKMAPFKYCWQIFPMLLLSILTISIHKSYCLNDKNNNDLSRYYHYSIDRNPQPSSPLSSNDHVNPYSSYYSLIRKSNSSSSSSSLSTSASNQHFQRLKYGRKNRPTKQWQNTNNNTNHTYPYHVLINNSDKQPFDNETLNSSSSTVIYQRQPLMANQQLQQSQQQQHPVQEPMHDQQEQPLPTYQCDSIITDRQFIIESPEYPAQYPSNRICSYYIQRNRSDVCQIELTISDMDIEDTPQCTGDYLDLGITASLNQSTTTATKQLSPPSSSSLAASQGERLCGLMLRNTRHSKNDRPYRGFSAEIQQLYGSCSNSPNYYPPARGPNVGTGYPYSQVPINVYNTNYPYGHRNPVGPYPSQQPYPINGRLPGHNQVIGQNPMYNYGNPSSNMNTGYGQRLYPPQHPLYNNYNYNNRPNDPNIYQQQPQPIPGTSSTVYPNNINGQIDHNRPYNQPYNNTPINYPNNQTNNGPVYLGSYCDVYIGEMQGEIRSPGYPFGYPQNHTCIYMIHKASDDVCNIEIIFNHFDVQTPNTKKDLTDNCYGDYLQLPDGERLCGYYTQSMSGDYKLKKYYEFYDTSDYLLLQFNSDYQHLPDGSGFWLEIKQLPNSCKTVVKSSSTTNNNKCDHIITGHYSPVDRIYSPGYPQYYGKRQQCIYFVRPMNDKTCEYELDLLQFNLEQSSNTNSNNEDDQCRKDYLQLPNRKRLCGHHKFRRIYQFPSYNDRVGMFYFHTDDQIEDRGYEIVVRQLPNSCDQYNVTKSVQQPQPFPQTSSGSRPQIPPQQPWNTNVYIPNNDPNFMTDGNNGAYLPPTPVYTYDNNTGMLQPYPSRPYPPSAVAYPPNEYGRKNIYGSPYGPSTTVQPNWITQPNNFYNLNDPKNVDHSGTIPLFYANGTLATRLPPMKPVDMIPYLKRGKTIIQKDSVGRSFAYNPSQDFNSNRSPLSNLRPDSDDQSEYQSSARLRQLPPTNFDQALASNSNSINVMPPINCDQTITRPVEYIRSPNFPYNYPIVTRCIYSIIKSDTNVCQIRLHILSLDIEYTPGCRNDYLHLESTGEKLCGQFNQPEIRLINYFGYSSDIRLIFNSDREITRTGFEIRIEQIPDSCNESQQSNNTSINAMLITLGRQFQQQLSTSSTLMPSTPAINQRTTRNDFYSSSVRSSEDILPMALNINNNNTATSTTVLPNDGQQQQPQRVCKTTTLSETYFESENFPLEYPSNIDCVYTIFRSNRNVCRLEIDFDEFNVGDENYFGPIFNNDGGQQNINNSNDRKSDVEMYELNDFNERRKQQNNRPMGECLNDFVEIDGIRYCGQRSGQQIAMNFPKYLNEISIRFVSVNSPHVQSFNGFRLKIHQIDENCRRSSLMSMNRLSNDVEMEDEFGPAIIESCPKLSPTNQTSSPSSQIIMIKMSNGNYNYIDSSSTIAEELIKIQSPQFSLPSQLKYESFLDCYYVIQKINKNICSLEIRFELFALEQSQQCTKDYLEINNQLRLCGKLPMDTIRVFEFFEDQMLIHFHTDSDQQDKGFAMILKQIRC